MNREDLLKNVRETLTNAGFYVSDLYSMRPVGFDLVARRDNSLLILKILTNVDALSEEVAKELKTLSQLLKASPILVGEKNGKKTLETNVVYDRFGVKVVNSETFKNHLLEGIPLEIYAAPGGIYVNLDHEKIINLRRNKNISLGSFARTLRVSRKTVQMYENGMNSSLEVAIRIEDLLGTNVTKSIDILKHKPFEKQEFTDLKKDKIMDFQKNIFSLLEHVGYKVIPMERCPFEAVSKDKKKILLTCVDKYDKKILKKAEVVKSISSITEKHAVLIVDKDVNKKNIQGTPIIAKRELKKLRGPEEIIELILERVL